MSDVPSNAQARLLLEELNQRTHKLNRRNRLLVQARGGGFAFSWYAIGAALAALALLFCPWEIPDGMADLLLLVAVVSLLQTNTRTIEKRLDALVQLLEQDGLLREEFPSGRSTA